MSIAEALARIDIRKNNECHAPFLCDYSIISKSTCDSEQGRSQNPGISDPDPGKPLCP